jgi:hypothetical protein
VGADDDFEIVDGLAEQRERYGIRVADTVRIRSTAETDRLGYAGREGQIFGETMPSSGAIEGERLIGEPEEDFALYVDFGEDGGAGSRLTSSSSSIGP